jgi:hypothetical protein
VFEFMFCPATLFLSVPLRAWPGGKHCSDSVTRGLPTVVFQPESNSAKQCLTVTMKGSSKMQTHYMPQILRTKQTKCIRARPKQSRSMSNGKGL